jgi:hypothetical protein
MTTTSTDRTGRIGDVAFKAPLKAASTAALTLSGEQTIDGVSCVTGDRVLVKNQASGVANGIYVVDTGEWSRSTDFDGSYDGVKGTLVYINAGGSTNGNTFWSLTASDPVVIGTTTLTYTQVLVPSDTSVSYTSARSGSVARTLRSRLDDIISVKNFGAVCDGTTDDTAAFQLAVNSVTSGTVEIFVPSTSKVTGTVTASTGTVCWWFGQGAVITGGGTLPFWSSAPTYNSSPNYGKRYSIWHGSAANPTTDGTIPGIYIQRVDASVTVDSPSYLISNIYSVFIRQAAGRGWLYGMYSYLEDASNSGAAQSVGVAGVAHATGAASTAVWGLYGEGHAKSAGTIATGMEANAYNETGSDYSYVDANPVAYPFTMGAWVLGGGTKKNTIGYGLGSAGNSASLTNSFRAGLFMQTYSVTEYGIDIQAMPKVGIRFKNGASTDGSHATAGGIGIDFGASASYSAGSLNTQNQGAMHLRGHAMCFGSDGLGHMYYDGAGKLQFNYNGNNIGYVNAAGGDIQLNGEPPQATVTSTAYSMTANDFALVFKTTGPGRITMLSAAAWPGRELSVKNVAAFAIESASANVISRASTVASTGFLAGTVGAWAGFKSNGVEWETMRSST